MRPIQFINKFSNKHMPGDIATYSDEQAEWFVSRQYAINAPAEPEAEVLAEPGAEVSTGKGKRKK